MKNPRHQLVLLGFICVGLSWDTLLLPLLSVALWASCLTWLQGRVRFRPNTEAILLVVGCVAGLLGGRLLGKDTHFFFGHGLTLIQAAWLLRPLHRREKVFSVLMACGQIGASCTFLFDLRFVPVFMAVLLLLPRALLELEAESFRTSADAPQPRLAPLVFAAIALSSLLVFVVFPRGLLGNAMINFRPSSGDSDSLLDSVVDSARGGLSQSGRLLLEVEGGQLGYLRCYGLAEFDGVRWTAASVERSQVLERVPGEQLAQALHRRVTVAQVAWLGRVLPTDGQVLDLHGNFIRDITRNAQGVMKCDAAWNSANNIYEYWINPRPKPEPLADWQRVRFVRHPHPSPRLEAWLDAVLAGVSNPHDQARRLEGWMQTNFVYKLGTPELDRLNPIDDFVFHQREGHCERFASTLAVLLRMKGIPSRVVIGYLPRTRNWITGCYSVRIRDAHAWTEGWFEDRGWVQFDATPAATLPAGGMGLREWWEALDQAWTMNVANLDRPGQHRLLNLSLQGLAQSANWVERHAVLLFVFAVVAALPFVWVAIRRWLRRPSKRISVQQKACVVANHHYGQMLRTLARQGFHRRPALTPFEFLADLRRHEFSHFDDARLITRIFCQSRYGDQLIEARQQTEIEQALERIKLGGNGSARVR